MRKLPLCMAALFVNGAAAFAQPVYFPASRCMFSTFPDACDDNSCGVASGLYVVVTHGPPCQAGSSGWDFAGTAGTAADYSASGHSVDGNYPKVRFWWLDNFTTANSGCQTMNLLGNQWYVMMV